LGSAFHSHLLIVLIGWFGRTHPATIYSAGRAKVTAIFITVIIGVFKPFHDIANHYLTGATVALKKKKTVGRWMQLVKPIDCPCFRIYNLHNALTLLMAFIAMLKSIVSEYQ
jgi:hypothetical protein